MQEALRPRLPNDNFKNKRTSLACDECRKKKIKCDGKSPCDACVKSMTFCIKSRKAAKRGPKAGYTEKLEARIRQLESLLTAEQWKHLEMIEFGQDSTQPTDISFLEKPLIVNTQDLRFDLIALYFKYDHHKVPFLHEHSFMHSIGGNRSCLLYAIYALGAMNQSVGDANDWANAGSLYYELAVNEVNQMSVRVADYHLIGACLLLMFYDLVLDSNFLHLARGNLVASSILYSRGCKLMLQSKYYEDRLFYPDGQRITETDREIRRRLFWLFYTVGLQGSFILGIKPAIPENIYHGSLPMDEEAFNLVSSLERKYGSTYFMQNTSFENQDQKVCPILFPLDDQSLSTVPTSHLTHLCRIMRVFEKIQEVNRVRLMGQDPFCCPKMSVVIQEIITSLKNWDKSFNSWLQRKQTLHILADNSIVSCTDTRNVTYILIPRILDDAIGEHDVVDVSTINSKLIVSKAAISISEILQRNNMADLFPYLNPFIHTMLFQLGITYAVLMVAGGHSDNLRYERELEMCISGLDQGRRRYLLSQSKFDLLRKIANSLTIRKCLGDVHMEVSEVSVISENFRYGYPLLQGFIPPGDFEEYKKSRKIMDVEQDPHAIAI